MPSTPTTLVRAAIARVSHGGSDRGDVPGWVLITLMTAVIVAALWTFAEGALTGILEDALCTVGVNSSEASCGST
ncbi:MAG TPA: hypothetical protein VNA12_05250 [Mycobacteriales bacterium]|nr:hypothetical protein [Mycobacteriales bacterium]